MHQQYIEGVFVTTYKKEHGNDYSSYLGNIEAFYCHQMRKNCFQHSSGKVNFISIGNYWGTQVWISMQKFIYRRDTLHPSDPVIDTI
jgi:hypothetical protein